jgi:hypothetical protein
MSAADKLGPASTVEPIVQSSEAGNMAMDTEFKVPPAGMSDGDHMVLNTSQSVTGRVAERLVSYSQKLMSSIRYVRDMHFTAFAPELISCTLRVLF